MESPEHYIPEQTISMLKRQHYGLFGHSASKLCHWTKASLTKGQVCYKQKFYGIQSHRCLQMTPVVAWCQQNCQFCWRPLTKPEPFPKDFSEPKEIVEESIAKQRMLLSGYGALKEQIGEKKLEEARNPNQVAISLAGEPTLYPKLPELVKEYKKNDFTSFVVSNGLDTEMFSKLNPTQLYLSLEAPNEKLHKKINAPSIKGSWEKINASLEAMSSIKTRRAIRITAIKGMNLGNEKEFASLIEKAQPDFVEVKAYMFIGYSRQRLLEENMPLHSEVLEFAEKINKHIGYTIAGESKPSRVVLLSSGKKKTRID
jgi:tRNA wybutosine-synthesizing protein 1